MRIFFSPEKSGGGAFDIRAWRQLCLASGMFVAVRCSVLQRVAVCCSVLQRFLSGAHLTLEPSSDCVLRLVRVLQCVAVCCSVLQKFAE